MPLCSRSSHAVTLTLLPPSFLDGATQKTASYKRASAPTPDKRARKNTSRALLSLRVAISLGEGRVDEQF